MFKEFSRPLLNQLVTSIDHFPWNNRHAYANLMAQTYYYTSHSVQLLGLMVSKTPVENAVMYDYLIRHIKEENHHEQLALADLNDLGYAIEDFPELDICRMLWEPQFYKINEIGTPVVFGYIMMLELLAVERAPMIASLTADLVSSGKCNRFMDVHGKEDIKHVERGFEQMENLEPKFHSAIKNNMTQTSYAYRQMLETIKAATI